MHHIILDAIADRFLVFTILLELRILLEGILATRVHDFTSKPLATLLVRSTFAFQDFSDAIARWNLW
jgi:hypothetical protein